MHRFLDFDFKKETKLIPFFTSQSFRGIAVSLLTLFSSVYIYKTFLELTGQARVAMLSVFIYFLSIYGFKFVANLLAEELSLRVGLKKQMYLGIYAFAICLGVMFFSLKWPLIIFLAAPFWGLATGFFWFGSHGMMVKVGRDGHFGKESGMMDFITTLPLVAVPIVGGLLIRFGGYQFLFLVGLIFIFLSGWSIRKMKEVKTRHDTNIGEVFSLFKTHKKTLLAYIGDTIAAVSYTVAIPLYIFLILQKELSLGGFFSLSMVIVAILNLLIGRWVDLKGEKGLIVYGSVFQAFVWFTRIFGKGIGVLFSLDVADRVTDSMVGIPLRVLSYRKALDGQSTGRAVLFREQAITIGAILTCLGYGVLALIGFDFKIVFLVAALASYLPILITRNHEKRV